MDLNPNEFNQLFPLFTTISFSICQISEMKHKFKKEHIINLIHIQVFALFVYLCEFF